jgi:hypothetical protein
MSVLKATSFCSPPPPRVCHSLYRRGVAVRGRTALTGSQVFPGGLVMGVRGDFVSWLVFLVGLGFHSTQGFVLAVALPLELHLHCILTLVILELGS